MTAICTYSLPHLSTETMPWVDSFCYTDDAVPAGCPMHFVSADPSPTQVTVAHYHGYNDPITTTPSTTAVQGSSTEQVLGSSPDCAVQINASVQYTRYEVMAPALIDGDTVFITYQTAGTRADGANGAPAISPAGACPTPTWPTTFVVTCGFGGDAGPQGSDPVTAPPPADRGCSAGGGSTFGAALSLLALATARRSRSRRAR